jgi:hypothetical protein
VKHSKRSAKLKTEPAPSTFAPSDRDKHAYARAIEWVRRQSPAYANQIETKLRCEGFEAAGEFAAYVAQCENLRLRPWQCPPCGARGEPPGENVYGHRPEEIELRDRLEAAGLSRYEPDPLAALVAVTVLS